MDQRDIKLSNMLVNFSCEVKKDENVLIDYQGEECKQLVKQLVRDVYAAGGRPFVKIRDAEVNRELIMNCVREQVEFMADCEMQMIRGMDAYIAIRGGANTSELSDVPADKMGFYDKTMWPPVQYRVDKTKWVVLRYPNPSMAQLANTSQEAFADFYYRVCTLDYSAMSRAMDPLKELLDHADRVQIKGPGTDLEFSIRGIGSVKCDGHMNIPDGEVYTAPVRESMNGVISYNTPSQEGGFKYDDIRFEIKDGRIEKATANDNDRINEFLNVDEGARYFGEFAFGVNPYILSPMNDILFDEKIAGSFHLTPGMCYEDAPNGNKSANHWDLVMIQRPEYGGGEIWIDGRLIRKDGLFVVPELEGLNPENLMR